jgi:hypothetical protein
MFIRKQSKYLAAALKAINLEEYEILLNEINVPNSINILNRLKEKLIETYIISTASTNKLTTEVNVVEIVVDLLQEALT